MKFVTLCVESGLDLGTLYWSDGRTENLIQLHRREATLSQAHRISELRGKLMRASDMIRGVSKTLFVDVNLVTNSPYCFSNLNTKTDLKNPAPRGPVGDGTGNVKVGGRPKERFSRAIRSEADRRYRDAALEFGMEARYYEGKRIGEIAFHCWSDYIRSVGKAGPAHFAHPPRSVRSSPWRCES